MRYSYRLSSFEANDQWRLLRSFIEPFQQHFKEKISPFGKEESALPSRYVFIRARHRWSNSMNRYELLLHPAHSPDLALWFPVSKSEEMIRRKEIRHQRTVHRRNRGLFWKIGQIILFGRLEKVGESLDQVYRAEKRLWEIKMNRSKKICFTMFF